MNGPSVSVVIPTCDRPNDLSTAVRSIALQTSPPTECLVVNDGRSPVNLNHLRSIFSEARNTQTSLILLETQNPYSGPATARNVGITHMSGTCWAFLDDDDTWDITHLERLTNALGDDIGQNQVVYSGTRVVLNDKHGKETTTYKAYEYSDAMLLSMNFIHTGSYLVTGLEASGIRFDQTLSVCEDWDYLLRLRFVANSSVSQVLSVTNTYHLSQMSSGLVNSHQETYEGFLVARKRLYSRWASHLDSVHQMRTLVSHFDRLCHDVTIDGGTISPLAFDRLLSAAQDDSAAALSPEHLSQLLEESGAWDSKGASPDGERGNHTHG